ncbi:hypothetical protein IW262DRAFT_1369380 [Armillaria fumosa]|nr:hypothetical protein IW262DRAFT_1369380 [Armillaria fumosa]
MNSPWHAISAIIPTCLSVDIPSLLPLSGCFRACRLFINHLCLLSIAYFPTILARRCLKSSDLLPSSQGYGN